jgi:hypothetical protein
LHWKTIEKKKKSPGTHSANKTKGKGKGEAWRGAHICVGHDAHGVVFS